MQAAGIRNAEGVNFSVPHKSEMASLLSSAWHTQDTHNNIWVTALSVYATADMQPEPFLAVIPRG